jgi:hypothetical protein
MVTRILSLLTEVEIGFFVVYYKRKFIPHQAVELHKLETPLYFLILVDCLMLSKLKKKKKS